jgi:hypothetical protein
MTYIRWFDTFSRSVVVSTKSFHRIQQMRCGV